MFRVLWWVMKGAGGGADLKGGQNRGIHLEESLSIEEAAQLPQNHAAAHKGILDLRVDDEVNIPLAITGLAVLQPMELFRQRQQRLGEQGDGMYL